MKYPKFISLQKILLLGLMACAFQAQNLYAATFYVATDGRDEQPGTLEKPFATLTRAQSAAAPGDTVYIRGGHYAISSHQIQEQKKIFAYVIQLNRSGEPDRPIRYWAYPDETPVFDFSAVRPEGLRVHAFSVSGSWLHLKGLEVVGVQVTAKGHTQSICFESNGSRNVFEQLSMHDGQAIGIYHVRGSDNLFLNCDAYRNHDNTSENGKGGNVDGFGCHPTPGSTNNVFRGCRAWFNSDDGFDCIGSHEAVIFENCRAFYNGYSPDFKSLGDGNGFKAGGYGSMPVARLPKPIPRHVVRDSLAVGNKASGFYANHHIGGGDWLNNRAYRNGTNFNMLCRLPDNNTDVPGYGHKIHGNKSYQSRSPIASLDATQCDLSNNQFVSANREHSVIPLDEKQLTQSRNAQGELPALDYPPEPTAP